MKSNRESLKKATEAHQKKKEALNAPQKDAFKMKQFKNVTSKLREDLQMQSARGEIRP